MKKITTILCCALFILAFSTHATSQDCTSIQEGVLTYASAHYLAGEPLPTGFDIYGYNYGAHLFSGSYAKVYTGGNGFPPYDGDDNAYYQRLVDESFADDLTAAETLMGSKWYWLYREFDLGMKWNDAWISSKDCDSDGKLDRHHGYTNYIDSGAWETNHTKTLYFDNGKKCKYVDFAKIIAVPADAYYDDANNNNKADYGELWYTATGVEIGPCIWGQFAIIQEVVNDPCYGVHGIQYLSPDHAGYGGW
jgi:hypothetical protein